MMKKNHQTIITEESQNSDVDFQTQENKKRILDVLKKIPAMFLSEISWETGMTDYQTRIILNEMWRDGEVEAINVDFSKPDERLLMRVPEMSARGQGDYDNFKKKRWFGVPQ